MPSGPCPVSTGGVRREAVLAGGSWFSDKGDEEESGSCGGDSDDEGGLLSLTRPERIDSYLYRSKAARDRGDLSAAWHDLTRARYLCTTTELYRPPPPAAAAAAQYNPIHSVPPPQDIPPPPACLC